MNDLLIVVGARPNFMKASSIVHAARAAGLTCTLVHTGQHYDAQLSRVFFEDLQLPEPDFSLGVGSASHTVQTARVMMEFEPTLLKIRPSLVIVVGDVNSTVACALVAAKEHFPVAHVEAGLRCYDARMAEEINRRVCDHLSTYHFTTSQDAGQNLLREGIDPAGICFVGNTMIDTLLRFIEVARLRKTPQRLGLDRGKYAVLTLHRAENVDDQAPLGRILDAVRLIARFMPVVFPRHPRTVKALETFGMESLLDDVRIMQLEPLGYVDFVGLVADAGLVLTDSGGLQEETTMLGVPCLTLRESTERPVTVTQGTNTIVGTDTERIVEEALKLLERPHPPRQPPELWDGRAGERIVEHLCADLYGIAEVGSRA